MDRKSKKYKNKSKSELIREFKQTYTCLHKNDLDWLNKNSPKLRTPTYEFIKVDLEARDDEILNKLKLEVNKIHQDTNKPKIIIISRLSYETGLKNILVKNQLKRMPKTSKYLSTVLESLDNIRIRKIEWGINDIYL